MNQRRIVADLRRSSYQPNSRMNPVAWRSGTRKTFGFRACLATASAARYPLRTAPSMVAGHAVAVQSPARNKRGHGVAFVGRYRSMPGTGEKVAFTSLITVAFTRFALP